MNGDERKLWIKVYTKVVVHRGVHYGDKEAKEYADIAVQSFKKANSK